MGYYGLLTTTFIYYCVNLLYFYFIAVFNYCLLNFTNITIVCRCLFVADIVCILASSSLNAIERFLEYINAQIIYTNSILLRYFWSLIQYTWFLTGIAKYDIDVGGYMPQYACNGLGRVVVAPRSRGALRGVKRKESSVVNN